MLGRVAGQQHRSHSRDSSAPSGFPRHGWRIAPPVAHVAAVGGASNRQVVSYNPSVRQLPARGASALIELCQGAIASITMERWINGN